MMGVRIHTTDGKYFVVNKPATAAEVWQAITENRSFEHRGSLVIFNREHVVRVERRQR